MKPLILLLALFAAVSLQAQPFTASEPFSLTNTRYATRHGRGTLASSGRDLLLFWSSETNLRVTKVVEGERRGGKNVFELRPATFDVTWNGDGFVLAAQTANGIFSRALDRNGEPVSIVTPVVQAGINVRIASNGRSALLLYQLNGTLYAVELDLRGERIAPPRVVYTPPPGTSAASYDIASAGSGYAVIISTRTEVNALTLDAAGEAKSQHLLYTASTDTQAGQVAIESNGRAYAAAWETWDGRLLAVAIATNGEATTPLRLDPGSSLANTPSITWSGSTWAVGFGMKERHGLATEVIVVEADEPMRKPLSLQRAAGTGVSIGVRDSKVVVAWQPDVYRGTVVAASLPFVDASRTELTVAAPDQMLFPMAASNDATLVTWSEREGVKDAFYVGVRGRDGSWSERRLFADERRVFAAASDGEHFVLLLRRGWTESALFLDGRGHPVRDEVSLPLAAADIVWDGTQYLILGEYGGIAVSKMSRGGVVSAPVVVAEGTHAQTIATNGTTTVVSWIEAAPCPPITCGFFGGTPRVMRLGRNLEPLDQNTRITDDDLLITEVELLWDGKRFLAVWSDGNPTVVRVPLNGGAAQPIATIDDNFTGTGFTATAIKDGIAIAALSHGNHPFNKLSIVAHDNRVHTITFPHDRNVSGVAVQALPDGSLLHLYNQPNYAAPHHGSRRVTARVISAVPTTAPDAPRIDAVASPHRVQLTWTPPAQAVSGYRVEYRVSDGAWHELDQWFDAGELGTVLPWNIAPGVQVRFRVRAFNERGPSAYSAPAGVNVTGRRRSVR